MSRSSVASIALVAAAVAGAVMWLCKAERARRPAHEAEVTRWEGEGGNVPDVAVETGNQGSGRAGKPALASTSASEAAPANQEEPWPFPRS
ncbi:hypothetical protein FXN63_05390 [Pigmentiphaga aceris]|uniref:Uncharacterized protein n=1 Tax=Pigmentiphaga aceris TaxID=1940612 RepID=A0A5C0ASS5_9BURK|nr:hypothetical protein [Pigmentiphaga aceris]QEI05339.1 hypothetical protein FXN63_05390 [Pigmentiphaga aceris]